MRRSALVFAVFSLTLCAAIRAQQQTFKSGVSLVTVDVTVLDKDGKPVPGLSAGDFEIKLNGKSQPVRTVAFVQASATNGSQPGKAAPALSLASTTGPSAAGEVEVRRTISNQDGEAATNPAPPPPVADPKPAPPAGGANFEPRTFVLMIDDLSFPATSGRALLASARRFVEGAPASDLVGFTTTSGLKTVNPTLDRASVTAGLAKVVGVYMDPRTIDSSGLSFGAPETGVAQPREQPLGIDEALEIEGGNDTLLLAVIKRECFGGTGNGVAAATSAESIADSRCAAGIKAEAIRTASLTKDTRRRQLSALSSVVAAMRATSGIRHLVILTNGLAMHKDTVDLQPFVRAAATAGVQLSVVMEDPDNLTMVSISNTDLEHGTKGRTELGFANRVREDNRLVLNGAQTMNDMAGGTFYRIIGSADPAFATILRASSAVYRLGVEMPNGTQAGKELALGVIMKRPGLMVRANKMAVNTAAAAPTPAAPDAPKLITGPVLASIDDVLKAALNQNQSLRGVPIRLGTMMRRSSANAETIDVTVNVAIGASAKTPITTYVGAVDASSALRVSRQVVESAGGLAQFVLPLVPGAYAIRFGASDADKALGTIELPIAVQLHKIGTFTSSDVMTWVANDATKKAALFAMDEVPLVGALHASIELYPSRAIYKDLSAEALATSGGPSIQWTVTREGETKPVLDEIVETQAGPSVFRSDVEIPFATFASGTYVIRATLLAADKPAGSIGAVVRKK